MKWRVGQILYDLSVDGDTGKVEVDEHVIRTIRGGKVHAIWKNSLTWGKLSSKHGDFGWLPNLPKWCRTSWRIDGDPRRLATTRLAAIRVEIKGLDVDDFQSQEAFDKASRTLKIMETRSKPKKAKKQ